MLTRKQATERILEAKKAKNLTFEAIAKAVGKHKVWVTAAMLGQGTMSKDEAARATEILGLGADVAALPSGRREGSWEAAATQHLVAAGGVYAVPRPRGR